ncbi:MAG: universal stress protein [Acidimicrobiales bacterium]|jgi:nucleotide-binding universal stress UspA family protein
MTTEESTKPRIVAGIDGSPSSQRALEWAARQAELTDSELEVIAAWEWPENLGWGVIPDGYNPASDAQKALEPIVLSLRAAHPKITVTFKIVEGHPAPVLVKASRGAELLIVGSRGHGEFIGMLIGSTSEHCVTNAACPVVVVRESAS